MPTSDSHLPLESAYRTYFPLVREKCRRMLVDAEEAADIAQETFVRFWRAQPGTMEPSHAVAWLYRTSTRLAVDRIRRLRPRQAYVERSMHEERFADGKGQLELKMLLRQVARRVPARELEIVVLHRLDGLDQREVGELTGMSERTVRRLLTSFDQRIQDLMSEET